MKVHDKGRIRLANAQCSNNLISISLLEPGSVVIQRASLLNVRGTGGSGMAKCFERMERRGVDLLFYPVCNNK